MQQNCNADILIITASVVTSLQASEPACFCEHKHFVGWKALTLSAVEEQNATRGKDENSCYIDLHSFSIRTGVTVKECNVNLVQYCSAWQPAGWSYRLSVTLLQYSADLYCTSSAQLPLPACLAGGNLFSCQWTVLCNEKPVTNGINI